MAYQTPKQLNDLGDQYFFGDQKEKNLEMAFTYYKKAADLNNPIGYFNVGKYFLAKKNHKQAQEYLIKAKALGYTPASILLSDIYFEGIGFRKNKKKAFKFMKEAVQANDVSAIHKLGYFYEKGIGCRKDENQALKYYQLSSDNKVAEGMYYLGSLLLEAKKIKRDFENGFFWLDKSSELGNILAIKKLKGLYHDSHPFLKKKSLLYLKEMEFYYDELLAKQVDIEALVRVGFTYYDGSDITKVNNEKAKIYFTKLHELDHIKGYTGVGLLYLYGKGVKTNYTKAKELLEISSTRGDLVAKNALGEIYRLGYGVDINYSRAKDYYFEAAKGEESNALINMGLMNYRNQIQGAKQELAFQYMQNAVSKGNSSGYYWLGIFYEKGIGCSKDFKKADEMFRKAIEFGNEAAKYKYAQMLFDHTKTAKLNNKKRNLFYIQIRDLLFDYVNSPITSEINTTYALYMLGELYSIEKFDLVSPKISRFYYESASLKKFTKALVKMYHILKDTEPKQAFKNLEEAVKRPADGESLYLLAEMYYEGNDFVSKDIAKARELYGKSAGLNYPKAKEKMTML